VWHLPEKGKTVSSRWLSSRKQGFGVFPESRRNACLVACFGVRPMRGMCALQQRRAPWLEEMVVTLHYTG
jgi:hypothetical protein